MGVKGLVTIYGEGYVSFTPKRRGGDVGKSFSRAEGGGGGGAEVVFTWYLEDLAILQGGGGGGTTSFHSLKKKKKGGGGCRDATIFGSGIFPLCRPPSPTPVINDQSVNRKSEVDRGGEA